MKISINSKKLYRASEKVVTLNGDDFVQRSERINCRRCKFFKSVACKIVTNELGKCESHWMPVSEIRLYNRRSTKV